jgi:O-antigen/teichoic acid export membrane protein
MYGMAVVSKKIAYELMVFGGWYTLSNIIAAATGQADRLILASLVSVAAVTSFFIPIEIVSQSLIIVGAITTVFYPYLAKMQSNIDFGAKKSFIKVLIYSSVIMGLISLVIFFYGGLLFKIWTGNENIQSISTADNLMKILSFGIVPYVFGTISTSLIHSRGRTDLTARIHILEAPLFIAITYFLVDSFGLYGAAISWVIRVSIDGFLIFYWALKLEK